jgi:SAM-dependent methyltransferase
MPLKDLGEQSEYFQPTLGLDVAPYIAAMDVQGVHHVARYQWACAVLREIMPRTVIDVACGAGFGSYMLAKSLPESYVRGVDYDARAISSASDSYRLPNLEFVAGDLMTWSRDGGSLGTVDSVVSFDTIEHIEHRDIALMRICDNLSDNGVLLLSTPCGHETSVLHPEWIHHKIEYSHGDLFGFLSRFFGRVSQPGDADYVGADFWTEIVNRDGLLYFNKMNPVICRSPLRGPPYNGRTTKSIIAEAIARRNKSAQRLLEIWRSARSRH